MAGAKPQRRGGGLTAIHIWLIVFVVLWVASTGTLIFLFTQQEQLRQTAAQAENDFRKVASRADLSVPAIAALSQQAAAGGAQTTLVRVMYEGMRSLAGRLTGNKDDDIKTIETQWNALVDEIASGGKVPDAEQIGRGTGVIPGVRQLYEWYVSERDARQAEAAAREQATRSLAEAEARTKALEAQFGDKLKELEKKVADISADRDKLAELKRQEVDDLGRNINSKKEELVALAAANEKQRAAHEAALRDVQKTLREQADVLATYRTPGPEGTNELDTARQPVGRVLRALPGDSLVHIDVGRLDGVNLGMPFAVYSFSKRVPVDGRGKATIEVVSVGPHTAECRVVSPPPADEPILEEDLVGNILLTRNRDRRPRFVVVGEFDIDYDGVDDPVGYDKVSAFIERFGGELTDKVDATTDYVVVGRRPSAPTAPTGADRARRDPTAPTRARRAARDAATYDAALEQALLLAVPRLRQDQFFNFVGMELGRDVAARLSP
ncbi:MAG: hypothetical protein L6Q92_05135 [Phycisphaerae bacterium]|nr:hypothetical protein [Phycisphaerae bacterium]